MKACTILLITFFLQGCVTHKMEQEEEFDIEEAKAWLAAEEAKYALPMPMERFFEGDVSVIGPMTIAEAEERSLKEMMRYSDVPHVPFGFINDKWLEFKTRVKESDDLYYFNTRSHEGSIAGGHAGDGYAIVRDGLVVDVFSGSVY